MNQRESQPVTVVQYAAPEAAVHDPARPLKAPVSTGSQSLLSRVLGASLGTKSSQPAKPSALEQFLASDDVQQQLELWFGTRTLERDESLTLPAIIQQLQRDVAQIDACVSRQLNAVLHYPAFQKLEASWRGLAHLTECADRWNAAPIILNVLNVTCRNCVAILRTQASSIRVFSSRRFTKKASAWPVHILFRQCCWIFRSIRGHRAVTRLTISKYSIELPK